MNTLIIKTSSLGDVIHMLPAITDAARALPQLHLDWLVEDSFAAIPAWHPAVNRVISVAMRRWKRQMASRQTWQEIGAARTSLRCNTYDLVVDSQGLVKSAVWTRFARGRSAGYDRQSIREPLAAWFYDRRISVPRQQHAVSRNRQLLAQALGYAVPASAPDYGIHGLSARLSAPGIDIPKGSVIGLHGTSRADKLWPSTGWIALAHALHGEHRRLVLPWGSEGERERAHHIASQASNVMVLPKLGLDDLAWILDQAQAVVGVDTGLLHLAAALGKPGLALYTATPPALTGALSDLRAPIAFQNLATPMELEPLAVTKALLEVLRNTQ